LIKSSCCLFSSEGGVVHILTSKSTNGETKLFDSMCSLSVFIANRFLFSTGNSIRLETEQEEKRLLHDQFRQLEISSNETITKLSKQIETVKHFSRVNK
jgi:hypothetical protein